MDDVFGIVFHRSKIEKDKDISKKDLFHLHGIYSIQSYLFNLLLISSCNFKV